MAIDFWKKLISKSFPTILFVASLLVIYKFTNIFHSQTPVVVITPTPTISAPPSEVPDYDAYNNMQNKITIADSVNSYSPKRPDGSIEIDGRVRKQLIVSGEFSRIYLYVKVSVDNGKPLTQWDSIFMSFGGQGGHLFRPDSLRVPNDSETQLLYALNQVPVISLPYSENKTPTVLDWFKIFHDGAIVNFDSFLSTLRPGGEIKLIQLGYECAPSKDCEIR